MTKVEIIRFNLRIPALMSFFCSEKQMTNKNHSS